MPFKVWIWRSNPDSLLQLARRERGYNAVLTIKNTFSDGCNGTKITLCFSKALPLRIFGSIHSQSGSDPLHPPWIERYRIAWRKLSKYTINPPPTPTHPLGMFPPPSKGECVCSVHLFHTEKGNTAALPVAKSLQDVQNVSRPNKAWRCSTPTAILVVWSRENENSTEKLDAWTPAHWEADQILSPWLESQRSR